jgi:hypothetical protein
MPEYPNKAPQSSQRNGNASPGAFPGEACGRHYRKTAILLAYEPQKGREEGVRLPRRFAFAAWEPEEAPFR